MRAALGAALALLLPACLIAPPEMPDAGVGVRPILDAGTGGGPGIGTGGGGGGVGTGGGGGGGGGGGSPGGGTSDGGTIATPIPGSGKDGDQGTGLLILTRVDRGTANIADSLAHLVDGWMGSVNQAGFLVTSVGVGDLYTGSMLWAARIDQQPRDALADVLRQASAAAVAAPRNCTTEALARMGASMGSLLAEGMTPFWPKPGALLVVLVDAGPRPMPLTSCPGSSTFGVDPASWAQWPGGPLPLRTTRFAFVASSETETADQMRARCLGVAGFPSSAVDSLAPSQWAFMGPLSTGLNGRRSGLAGSIDLCNALGTSEPSFAALVTQWYGALATGH